MRVHYGVDYVENSIANRRNRFVNKYGEISVSNVVLIRFVCFTRILVAFVLRYDTRCYFNVRSKANISQLNLPHGTDN